MTDKPDTVTLTLTREEAVALHDSKGAGLGEDIHSPAERARFKIRDAIDRVNLDNPQPSDTGRYEEALRERLRSIRRYSHDTSTRGLDRGLYPDPNGEWIKFSELAEQIGRATLQPGEKHG